MKNLVLHRICDNIGRAIVGKREAIEQVLVALVCGGHVLIEDAPGLGKTTLASSLAQSIGCSFGRIQFTPDLLPADIVGFTMFDMATGEKRLCQGGIMYQLVLADEINRATPKTQSALLEAMQEGQVTVDSQTLPLPRPFMVLATQNPLEFSGTYPLPESQMDRFLLRIVMGYPTAEEEVRILDTHYSRSDSLEAVASAQDILHLQETLPQINVCKPIKQYIVDIVAATRTHKSIALPVSPRGSIALMRAAMGAAMLDGRNFVLPDDVQKMAKPVLAHRIVMRSQAYIQHKTAETVLDEVLRRVAVPAVKS